MRQISMCVIILCNFLQPYLQIVLQGVHPLETQFFKLGGWNASPKLASLLEEGREFFWGRSSSVWS
jgi:hypothetical protein